MLVDGEVEGVNAKPSQGGRVEERWYVAQTQPHAENKALFHLQRQNYRVFCPRLHRTVRHARKTTKILAPFFPGYVFVNLAMGRDRWRPINSTHGVLRLIMQNELPQPVPRGVVEAIKNRVGLDGAVDSVPVFTLGQPVCFCDGPLVEFAGTLDCLDASGRVRVLLDLMGRTVLVSTRLEMLAPSV